MAEVWYGPVAVYRVKPRGRSVTQDEQLENWFTHHPPAGPGEVAIYQEIRKGGRELAELIVDEVPAGIERDEALRHVRAAVMWANAGIACGPRMGDEK